MDKTRATLADPRSDPPRRVRRNGSSRALPVVASFLPLVVLLVVVSVLDPRAAAAQSSTLGISLLAQEAGGRELALSDWVNHVPLALGAALLVIAVDAFVIIRFIRSRRRRG